MGGELDPIIRCWNAFELVSVAGVGSDEVEVILFLIIEGNGLVGVIQLCLCACCSLLIIGFHEVVALFFVVEEEVDHPHFGVHSLVLGIGVKIDSTGKGVLEFRIVAGDFQRSVVVVRVDSHQLVELVFAIALLNSWLDDFPAELAGSALALDFELHFVYVDLAERAELAVGVEEAAGGVLPGGEGDGDGIFGELVVVAVLSLSFFEEEDQRLASFYAIDIIASCFFMLTEEVIGLNHSLPLLLGLHLLGQLLLVPPALPANHR